MSEASFRKPQTARKHPFRHPSIPPPSAFAALVRALCFQLRYREAAKVCEEGLKTAPDDSELNRRLALCLFKTRRFREAAGNPASRFIPRSNLTKPKPAEAGFLSFVCRGILLPGVLDVGLRRRVDARRRATLPPASFLAQTSQNQSPPKRAFCLLCAEEYYFLGFLMLACAAASLAMGTRKGEQDT